MWLWIALSACSPAYVVTDNSDKTGTFSDGTDSGGTDTGPSEEELDAIWAGARLEIHSPLSGAFLPLGEDAGFSATVYDAAGNATDFSDITWASSVDSAWALLGADVLDNSLSVGTHTLVAEAQLPNGDRLAYAVGGVLVQSDYAGLYTGVLSMTAAYDTYSVGCAGGATVVVDAAGEAVTGEATCLLSLQGFELDGSYVLDMENADGAVAGTVNLDLQWFQLPVDGTGTLDHDGNFTTDFTASFDLGAPITITGHIDASRLTRDLSQAP